MIKKHWLAFIGIIPAILFVAQFTQWAMERTPPRKVGTAATVFAGYPGSTVLIDVPMYRDMSRICTATVERYFIDADGTRFASVPVHTYTPQAVAINSASTPDRLKIALQLPFLAERGQGQLVNVARYQCNPLHMLWPINFVFSIPVRVL